MAKEMYGRAGFLQRKNQTGNMSENKSIYWHKLVYAAAGYTSLKFFGVARSVETTNWISPNRMPEDFILERVGFAIFPGTKNGLYTDLTDTYKILSSGEVNISINEIPALCISPIGACGNVVPIQTSITTSETAGANTFRGFVDIGKAPFMFQPAVSIPRDTSIEFEIKWAAKVAVTTDSTIIAYLIGHKQSQI